MHPMYRVSDWVNDWEKKEQLVENITAYPTSSRVSSSNPAKRTHNIQEATSNKVSGKCINVCMTCVCVCVCVCELTVNGGREKGNITDV